MITRILIARHGNTFLKNQTPTRIGRRTDLPLIEKELGYNLGKYIKINNLIPTIIWAAPLQRTWQTAELAIEAMQEHVNLQQGEQFLEIDHGPDENKTEYEVELRLGKIQAKKMGTPIENYSNTQLQILGKQVIANWNKQAIVPDGWQIDPQQCITMWLNFAITVEANYPGQTVMVISSNGLIRFAPHIAGNFDKFTETNNIKIATGNLCIFEKAMDDQHWHCIAWNVNPSKQLAATKGFY